MIVENPPSRATGNFRPDESGLREAFLATGDAARMMAGRSLLVEASVQAAHDRHLPREFPDGLAVLAVGGFGRRELFPHSDIDVLLLVDADSPSRAQRDALLAFQQALWDSGLRLSHSVRTVRECCELHDNNIELSISLLDRRMLCGDDALYEKLQERWPKFMRGEQRSLTRHLCRLARSRHAALHETIYHLEPNVKETPGGIRDVHLLEWLDKLRMENSAPYWQRELEPAKGFLYALRCDLHYRAGRDNNVLSFDAQDEIAARRCPSGGDAAPWMREYFRHVRAIHSVSLRALDAQESQGSSLLAGFRDWRTRLSNADFTVSRERLYFKAPQQLEHDPALAMRLFEFTGRHGIRPSQDAERRLAAHHTALAAYYRDSRPLWNPLRDILSQPHAALALRVMHETGFLRLVLPEWEQIECLVVRDFYHRYTVDEHTLVTIETLDDMVKAESPGRRRFALLYSELEEPALLRLALLLHDLGKGVGDGGHSAQSAGMAAGAMERIQLPATHRPLVMFLVQHHLDLSAAMTGRDLDDPATGRFLADRVGTIEALRYLVLMTYADIAAVNPTALSPWRLEQLWRVYLTTFQELTRELAAERIDDIAASTPEREAFLKGFPVRYLRTHSDAEVNGHLALDRQRRHAGVAIDLRKTDSAYQLTILAKDRLFLFASLAGAVSSFGMNILKAEAFANQQGTILDTFVFADPARTLELNPTEMDRLRHTVERVGLGRTNVKDLLKHRPRLSPAGSRNRVEARVTFDEEASATATLVEVVAEDRPGLLYDLASSFSEAGCSIDVVLVDTEAHKALDVFYVTSGGGKLNPATQEALRESLMRACSG